MKNARKDKSTKRAHDNREFIAGIIVLTLAVAITIGITLKKSCSAKTTSPIAKTITKSQKVKVTPTPSPTPTPKTRLQTVTVDNGDSYARISQRICGTQKYVFAIQALNGNLSLQPGDTVKVNCQE